MKKNLLVITNGFPDITANRYNCNFVYDYVDLIKKDFQNIYIYSPQTGIPKFLQNFPIIRDYENQINFKDYRVNNITVHYPKIKLFPLTIVFPILKEFLMKKDLLNFIRDKKISLVHCHFIYPAGYLGSQLKRKLGVPFVVTSHEGNITDYLKLNSLIKKRSAQVFETADQIIAVSESTKKAIICFQPRSSKRVKVINNFTNTDLFKPIDKDLAKRKLGFNSSLDKIVLNVANLIIDKKGQLDAIDTIHRLINKIPNIKLILIGTGPDESIIKNKIKSLSLDNSVYLIGALNNKDLPIWYNAADLFLFPSYYESFGIAQIEAASCNTPVVAYSNDGSKEILSKGIGALVKIGDIESLTQEVEKYLINHNEANCRRLVLESFSREAIYKKIAAIYSKILEENTEKRT